MTLSRRKFIKTSAATFAFWQAGSSKAEAALEPAAGLFQPSWDSLKQYQCPDWFRNAKFGIWFVWGPCKDMFPVAVTGGFLRATFTGLPTGTAAGLREGKAYAES